MLRPRQLCVFLQERADVLRRLRAAMTRQTANARMLALLASNHLNPDVCRSDTPHAGSTSTARYRRRSAIRRHSLRGRPCTSTRGKTPCTVRGCRGTMSPRIRHTCSHQGTKQKAHPSSNRPRQSPRKLHGSQHRALRTSNTLLLAPRRHASQLRCNRYHSYTLLCTGQPRRCPAPPSPCSSRQNDSNQDRKSPSNLRGWAGPDGALPCRAQKARVSVCCVCVRVRKCTRGSACARAKGAARGDEAHCWAQIPYHMGFLCPDTRNCPNYAPGTATPHNLLWHGNSAQCSELSCGKSPQLCGKSSRFSR